MLDFSRLILLFFFFCVLNIKSENLRDPFFLPEKQKVKKDENNKTKEHIDLAGIVKVGGKFGAILKKDFEQEVVFLNDKIWGYSISKITFDYIILEKEERRIVLNV